MFLGFSVSGVTKAEGVLTVLSELFWKLSEECQIFSVESKIERQQERSLLYGNFKDRESEKILWKRYRSGKGPGRGEFIRGRRRICSCGGNFWQWKKHPSSHAGRSGLSYRRESICGRKGHFFSE